MPTLNITVKDKVVFITTIPRIDANDSLNVPVDAFLSSIKEACARVAESLVTKQSKRINDGKPYQDHMHWEDIAIAIRELNVDSLDISPERVEKTPKCIHMRQAGSFSANY